MVEFRWHTNVQFLMFERVLSKYRVKSLPSMHDNRTSSIKPMYDERSEGYDNSFHIRQAQEYIGCGKPSEGETLLDLACGTGLLILLTKKQVGRGRVV